MKYKKPRSRDVAIPSAGSAARGVGTAVRERSKSLPDTDCCAAPSLTPSVRQSDRYRM